MNKSSWWWLAVAVSVAGSAVGCAYSLALMSTLLGMSVAERICAYTHEITMDQNDVKTCRVS